MRRLTLLLALAACTPSQLQIATQAANAHKQIVFTSADLLHVKCTVRYEAVKTKIAAGLIDEAKAELAKFDKPCLGFSAAYSAAKVAQIAAEEALQIAKNKQAPDILEILDLVSKLEAAVTALNKAAKAMGGE